MKRFKNILLVKVLKFDIIHDRRLRRVLKLYTVKTSNLVISYEGTNEMSQKNQTVNETKSAVKAEQAKKAETIQVRELSTLPSDLAKRTQKELLAMHFKKGSIAEVSIKALVDHTEMAKVRELIAKTFTGKDTYSKATIIAQTTRAQQWLNLVSPPKEKTEPKKEASK